MLPVSCNDNTSDETNTQKCNNSCVNSVSGTLPSANNDVRIFLHSGRGLPLLDFLGSKSKTKSLFILHHSLAYNSRYVYITK